MTKSDKSFFASAMNNRTQLLTPGAPGLVNYGNGVDGQTSAGAYNSRVLSSQMNGAGAVVSPINAPWSFADFATGNRSLLKSGKPLKSTLRYRGR